MKKVFTAEEISGWFTSSTGGFTDLKLTEEAAEKRFDDAVTKESR